MVGQLQINDPTLYKKPNPETIKMSITNSYTRKHNTYQKWELENQPSIEKRGTTWFCRKIFRLVQSVWNEHIYLGPKGKKLWTTDISNSRYFTAHCKIPLFGKHWDTSKQVKPSQNGNLVVKKVKSMHIIKSWHWLFANWKWLWVIYHQPQICRWEIRNISKQLALVFSFR
jgi:hypothetical protein